MAEFFKFTKLVDEFSIALYPNVIVRFLLEKFWLVWKPNVIVRFLSAESFKLGVQAKERHV